MIRSYNECEMKLGWFVGDFSPTAFRTKDCEVAVKRYNKDDEDQRHFHKVSTEITFVVSGTVEMNGSRYESGDIVVIEPNEIVLFRALTDSVTVVVKVPSVKGDKYTI